MAPTTLPVDPAPALTEPAAAESWPELPAEERRRADAANRISLDPSCRTEDLGMNAAPLADDERPGFGTAVVSIAALQ